MDRRGFLKAFAASIAVCVLPKQLVPPTQDIYPRIADPSLCGYIDPAGSELWAALYALDPKMKVNIDLKHVGFQLFTKVDRTLVENVVWNWKPVGVYAMVNGSFLEFKDHYRRLGLA